ncbi:MDR family NADP-dependent oxidoreductase [Streptomyces pseudovenezuelae]|uniref:NADPH-dependent curcumin reductase CurA n=1 Tax=Streptomyces pseudovenezuelae TaxID=67350 RepID=A0ABT6LGJ5_9ACTN|nr:NADP-dependent oxidoreductase [Streptomyces pseudovenezuelae]MDH6214499.1 NADPH-dependent curcumin reductase CurA [Streptomyces pseudovenezuelae]
MSPSNVPATHREVRLASRPERALDSDHFVVAEVPLPQPGPGQVLVRNRLMSVAASLRTLMRGDAGMPMPSFEVGRPLSAPAVGEVVTAPEGGTLRPGDLVSHWAGFREYAVMEADAVQPVDLTVLPDPVAYLSQGPSAWIGVVRGAEVREGDTVFVSGAAGGLGTLAGQFARLRGAGRVIGSTSSQRKADYLIETLGYDAVVLRGAGPIEDQLRKAAPEGIDAVVDTVGGEQLQAALALARPGARVGLIGALSAQVSGENTAPVEIDVFSLILRGIQLRGVSGARHRDALAEYQETFGRWLREGSVTVPHARLSGIDQAPRALMELLEGHHIGTVVVEL